MGNLSNVQVALQNQQNNQQQNETMRYNVNDERPIDGQYAGKTAEQQFQGYQEGREGDMKLTGTG